MHERRKLFSEDAAQPPGPSMMGAVKLACKGAVRCPALPMLHLSGWLDVNLPASMSCGPRVEVLTASCAVPCRMIALQGHQLSALLSLRPKNTLQGVQMPVVQNCRPTMPLLASPGE